jgi:hypothetical protein
MTEVPWEDIHNHLQVARNNLTIGYASTATEDLIAAMELLAASLEKFDHEGVGPDFPPEMPAHLLRWQITAYQLNDDDRGVYAYATLYPKHPKAPEGKYWKAYCNVGVERDRLDGWYPTGADALEAVEDFVFEHVGASV